MIALPVAAHDTPRENSPGIMAGEEEWPSLGTEPVNQNTNTNSAAKGDDWELLTPADDDGGEGDNADDAVVDRCFIRKNSVSAPDLRGLDENEDESEGSASSASGVMVSNPPSVITSGSAWGEKGVSFKDAILTPSKHASARPKASMPRPKQKKITKSRYVVTPIKRCAKSAGDLPSLLDEVEDEDILGETDAMEYYNRKSHGEHGRNNGLKQRPDEAKRKEMIVQKKNMQRQRQGKL